MRKQPPKNKAVKKSPSMKKPIVEEDIIVLSEEELEKEIPIQKFLTRAQRTAFARRGIKP